MGVGGEGELQGFSAEDRNLLAFCPQTLSLFFLAGEKHDIIGDFVLYTHIHTHTHSKELLLLLSHFSRVRLGATPETAAHQAPPSLGFSRQEHWSGLPFPSSMRESEK